jgi:eukaryotic-like serine/threonine-protein kinase
MEKFGKYQLIRRIGAGGMAEVFLARTTVAQGLAKELVIKKILPAYASHPEFVSMFVSEARIALGLNHPNIVQVFDFGQVGDTFFLAMEHNEGVDVLRMLQAAVQQERDLPLGLCAYIVQEMAKGLDYAHRKSDEFGEPLGIVHRDVSPQNVLVSWDGAVKIVDFGIARARGINDDQGVITGKYSYMSPEQARGEPVDRRADVYSAGVVLYELCCGRPLFPGRGRDVLAKVKAGIIPRPTLFNANIPGSLEQTMLKALASDREQRFATARDLQVALGAFQFEQAQTASDLVDADTLARFLAEIMADELRAQQARHSAPEVMDGPVEHHTQGPGIGPASSVAGGMGAGAEMGPEIGPVLGDDDDDDDEAVPGLTDPAVAAARSAGARSPGPAGATSEVRARKHVMVLHGHVRGLPALQTKLGATHAGKIAAQFFAVASDIAFKHESVVHQIGEDTITILVGLPVASEDDASRAIRLGLALIDALDGIGHDIETGLRLAVGIQRGMAVVVYRGGNPGEIELQPSEISLAERLARRAPGAEILVGSQVYRVARSAWNLEPVSPVRAEGDDDVQRLYRLRGPKERADRLRERAAAAGDLIGRDLEVKALRDAYRDVSTIGGTRHVVLLGEAGVGKRTIVNAFLAGVPADEAVIMRATTQVATLYTPYALLGDIARDIFGLAEGADPRQIERRVERLTPIVYPGQPDAREARGAMAAIGILLGVQPRAGTEEFDADELRERMLQVIARVRRYMEPKKPIVIIGEDLHWADDDSLGILCDVFKLSSRRPILGVFTSRPDDRTARYARDIGAEIMRVGELDQDSSMKLIARRFAQDTEPGVEPGAPAVNELAGQILERTGGNPFFIQEVLDSLIDRGIVVVQPDPAARAAGAADADRRDGLLRWVARDEPIQVPTSIEALLATRIDRLSIEQKQALMHAAVFGRVCRAEEVSALLDRPTAGDLDALVERGLLAGGESQYSFRNDMSMSVAYGLVPAEDRPRLHRAAARLVADSPLHGEGQELSMIARHLELAGDFSDAADGYMSAAAHAMGMGGASDALRLLGRAIKLLPESDHARRFEAYGQREKALHRLGRRPQQLRDIRALQSEAEALGDPAKLAQAHIRLGQYYVDVGRPQPAADAIGPALEHARAAGDALAQAAVLTLRATVARLTGNSEEALRLCEQALELCDSSRDGLSQRATIVNVSGGALWSMGKLEAAIESFAESLVIYRMLDLPRKEARALNNMGIAFMGMGEYEEALGHYKSALKIDQELGDRGAFASKLSNIGQAYSDLGDTERAERYLSKAIKLAERMDDIATSVDAMISLGQVYRSRGDIRRAMSLLERGLEMANENRDRYQEIRALIYLTLARLEAGYAADELLDLTRLAVEIAERIPMPVGQIQGLAVQGLVLSAMGRQDEAADAGARALSLQAQQNRPVDPEEIFYYHAILCERAGRRDQAVDAISAAFRELDSKASRLQDPELKATYLASRLPRNITESYQRLIGSAPG